MPLPCREVFYKPLSSESHTCSTCALAAHLYLIPHCLSVSAFLCLIISHNIQHHFTHTQFEQGVCPWPLVSASPIYLFPHTCPSGTIYPFFFFSHLLNFSCFSLSLSLLHKVIPISPHTCLFLTCLPQIASAPVPRSLISSTNRN